MSPPMRYLSLGWGVQSWTLAAIEGIAEEWVVKEVERLKEQNDSFCVELVTEGVLLKERIEALERVAEAARVCLKRRGGESACWN